ncbi:MAG: hypothetical protein R8G66_11140 [Cytophagales bacterium]|nr:hypothetical protein [Cytophagales bacterium]
MSKLGHKIYIWSMSLITVALTIYLAVAGFEYYATPETDRFYLDSHDWFKPSGIFGQGLGVIGTLLMVIGVVIYILRKRYNFLSKFLRLKYLLEFHIFLCTIGPIMVLFHTAFKFGGIVSIAFWSMVAIVASGVIGRFIYIQIPRTIEGREMTLGQVKHMKSVLSETLRVSFGLDQDMSQLITSFTDGTTANASYVQRYFNRRNAISTIKKALTEKDIRARERRNILKMVNEEITLAGRIERLQTMQKLFKYWHVAHLPFALIMLIIVVLHVGVAIAFGYTWIF